MEEMSPADILSSVLQWLYSFSMVFPSWIVEQMEAGVPLFSWTDTTPWGSTGHLGQLCSLGALVTVLCLFFSFFLKDFKSFFKLHFVYILIRAKLFYKKTSVLLTLTIAVLRQGSQKKIAYLYVSSRRKLNTEALPARGGSCSLRGDFK